MQPSLAGRDLARAAQGYFKLFVARDPYDRLLSAYLSKIVKKLKEGKSIRMHTATPGKVPSFAEFCKFIAEGGLYADYHWSPQMDYLVLPIEKYDLVARLEAIDVDFRKVAAAAGCDPSEVAPGPGVRVPERI